MNSFTADEQNTIATVEGLVANHDMYVLPVHTHLYRGDTSQWKYMKNTGSRSFEGIGKYFGVAHETAHKYGCVHQFRTAKDLQLVAMDVITVNSKFYKDAPADIQQIMRENYGVPTRADSVRVRRSKHGNDDKLVAYLCSLGLDGYLTKYMPGADEYDGFHPEIVLCKPSEVLEFVKYTSTPDDCNYRVPVMRQLQNQDEHRGRRRRMTGLDESPVRNPGMRLFGDDDEDESPKKKPVSRSLFSNKADDDDDMPSVGRRLFGGKTRRTKRKTSASKPRRTGKKRT